MVCFTPGVERLFASTFCSAACSQEAALIEDRRVMEIGAEQIGADYRGSITKA